MPGPAIKICGINTARSLDATITARADYAGLVFYPPSPRHVSVAAAAALAARADRRIRLVGLFVDADDATIAEAVSCARLDVLQLHGSETPERASRLRAQFGLPVWKALAVSTADDIQKARAYAEAVDMALFDAKTPKGTLPGGMGLSFDWSLVANWRGPVPWGLAGGLRPDNVAEAIRSTGASLVDTSSGVETAPGVKDGDLIADFCKAARRA